MSDPPSYNQCLQKYQDPTGIYTFTAKNPLQTTNLQEYAIGNSTDGSRTLTGNLDGNSPEVLNVLLSGTCSIEVLPDFVNPRGVEEPTLRIECPDQKLFAFFLYCVDRTTEAIPDGFDLFYRVSFRSATRDNATFHYPDENNPTEMYDVNYDRLANAPPTFFGLPSMPLNTTATEVDPNNLVCYAEFCLCPPDEPADEAQTDAPISLSLASSTEEKAYRSNVADTGSAAKESSQPLSEIAKETSKNRALLWIFLVFGGVLALVLVYGVIRSRNYRLGVL